MAAKLNKKTSNSMMENLENRQMFSGYGTVNVSLTAITPSVVVDYTRNGVDQSFGAGEFVWTCSATKPGTCLSKATGVHTFCIEPDQDVTTAVVNYTVSDLTGGSKCSTKGPLTTNQANAIRELWGRFHSGVTTDGVKGAAFQMAIWELVCDNDRNLSTGTFSVDNTTATDIAVKAQAQCMLNAITGCGPKANLLALTSPTDQDQIFEIPTCTPPTHCITYSCDYHASYPCILKHTGECLHKTNSNCGSND